ncbi:GNAT family N-acetyltransferase [Sphaerisporangium sp. TRM90804]|uniref:GNAT family N-acetyltransferase n=1 Tax=Sphaerisporangium sp. TRM90804 TaxID=3031113 RepID=UPI002446B812|nr:GNAT family N-acetyltransferase [Sphaerisporangium sp. TRM90804]MDH2425829.1 GNAT family N-acetyltransferase [Sphaerisporangium sp. TRM90804]
MNARIRPYRDGDRDDLYDICNRTADAGEDASHLYPDPELMPGIFAAPYTRLEPELAFVVDDGRRVVGYIVGTADTAGFVKAFREVWLPTMVERYPVPLKPASSPSEEMIALMHDPERMILPELADYPAHLHIDLLPGHQRSGFGRALMGVFLGALAAKGVGGVHLCMLTKNTRARAFYDRMGFHEIAVPDPGPVTYLGRSTDPIL